MILQKTDSEAQIAPCFKFKAKTKNNKKKTSYCRITWKVVSLPRITN